MEMKVEGRDYEKIDKIRSILGDSISETEILRALSLTKNNADAAMNMILDTPGFMTPSITVKKTVTSTGARISTQIKNEMEEESAETDPCSDLKPKIRVKEENPDMGIDNKGSVVKKEEPLEEFDRFQKPKEEPGDDVWVGSESTSLVPYTAPARPLNVRQVKKEERRTFPPLLDDGEFPEEADWLLLGRTTVMGLSTCRRKRLDFNEIVYFTFPGITSARKANRIVRVSTTRSGEIGRLPLEWSSVIFPYVTSSRVKLRGRYVDAPLELDLIKEIHLFISVYVNRAVFTAGDDSSWMLAPPTHLDSLANPFPTLCKLLELKPFKQAELTVEELSSRKRCLLQLVSRLGDEEPFTTLAFKFLEMFIELEIDLKDVHCAIAAEGSNAKRARGPANQFTQNNTEEQTITEATLNRLIGAKEVYNLEEMNPPRTLTCVLHPYQKQALRWMSDSEEGINVENAANNLHPCWEIHRLGLPDRRTTEVYVNIFSGEATTRFPTTTRMARGGILADAMGLGKTVMTIALILARRGKGSPDNQENVHGRARGGTLIVCPMALLGQWKDELENHSVPGTLQVCVQYGVDRTCDPRSIARHDVVLTTYGVLSQAYKMAREESIFNKVDWLRVVLDEAHTIKSSKTQGAQAAYALSSHCRWCLTGTPLQNSLEDLFSLLCFLRVEPWSNWAWWQKLIQKPYENGDERGLKLVKAILKSLMLRRTKDTKDKEGRPILVLPPAKIEVVECKQSDVERDFYDALFKRSKIQFEHYVAEGNVLKNYASILELLLRLRQCCNHPFLVMGRADSKKYVDLNELSRRFLEGISSSNSSTLPVPSRAYVEEVVEGIRRGEDSECPICLESADDPVLTPCAHRMCKECLLTSWNSSHSGTCPICRQTLSATDLIACPTAKTVRFDPENNWKESCKVVKLLECLETLRASGSGEKSIIFSQWTSFFDLLEIPLRKSGVGFLRFDGSLAQKNREYVLKEFGESQEKMVLLMSLKAGGVGLNLTAASNVFLMDPWWNPAVEEQAIMRIHRIGQKRVVSVKRFIVKDTVEERMQQIQARKQRMVAGALTDDEVRTARIEELKMLFR